VLPSDCFVNIVYFMLKKVVEVVREEGGADVLPTDPARTDIIGGGGRRRKPRIDRALVREIP
jgi:hypothetical protein